MPKICYYATQHVEAGSEEKVKKQKKHIFKNFRNNIFELFKKVISLISDFLFRSSLSMLNLPIVTSFGHHPLDIIHNLWSITFHNFRLNFLPRVVFEVFEVFAAPFNLLLNHCLLFGDSIEFKSKVVV